MPKVGMVSLGCPKNLVDSEVMLGILAHQGYELTPHPDQADIIIVNTCAFIEPAKQESINTILEMAEYKKIGAAKKLVVAGCLVERYRQEILEQIPEVDDVIGTNELERVLEACQEKVHPRTAGTPAEPYLYHEFTPRVLSTPGYSAYLKIAEGCDHPCSFCVIPQMRGAFRSRRFASVIREAENLARQGVREITIVGQDTTSYGEDLGLRDGLPALLRELGKIPELVWVRFLYCYPNRVTEALIAAVAETPKVAKYFDIPLQHASSSVLKLMKRGSSGRQFLRLMERIRAAIPGVALRTSFIVGFPGETDDDFRALLDFVAAAEFDHLGVFLYSNEEGSRSFALPNQVPAPTARRRQNQLMALQRKISRRNCGGWWGNPCRCWWKDPQKKPSCSIRAAASGRRPASTGASSSMISRDPRRSRGIFAGPRSRKRAITIWWRAWRRKSSPRGCHPQSRCRREARWCKFSRPPRFRQPEG